MPDLLLCGATGDLGSRIAARLADRGEPFRALVRPASRTEALRGAELAVGDLTDPPSLNRALAGVRTVVTTANSVSRTVAGERGATVHAVDRRGNAALVAAAERAGVERFVYVSAYGLTERMVRLSPFAAAKRDTERLLESSPMPSVIVRPGAFLEVWLAAPTGIDLAKRRAVVFGRGESPVTWVSEDDVAEACVRVATMPSPPEVVDVGGPAALSRRDGIALYEEAFGHRFRRVVVPRPSLALACRATRRVRPALASVLGIALAMDLEGCAPSPSPLRELGVEPRSVEQFVADLARRFRP